MSPAKVGPGRRPGLAILLASCAASLGLAYAPPAFAVACDGTELLCLDLLSADELTSTSPTMTAGQFLPDGFQPDNQGGLEWAFGSAVDLSHGRVEMDVTGLVPVEAGEGDGGKVSLFSLCGTGPDANYDVGLQKMTPDYREGHVFRFGMDNDGLYDNWDAVIISSADFVQCPGYDIRSWTADQTHHVVAEWGPTGMSLQIDGDYSCQSGGNGDALYAVDKVFTLANRCQHYPNQQAVARFRNLRLWALGDGSPPPAMCGDNTCGAGEDCNTCGFDCPTCGGDAGADATDDAPTVIQAVSLSPTSGTGDSQVFQAVYSITSGPATFRTVQLAVWDDVSDTVPSVQVGYEAGEFNYEGATCPPGAAVVLSGAYGALDCSASAIAMSGDQLIATWALRFDVATFGGQHGVFLDAKGGTPEVRLGWTQLGTFTVAANDGGTQPDAGAGWPSLDGAAGAANGAQESDGSDSCACRAAAGGSRGDVPWACVALALAGALRVQRRRLSQRK